MQKKSKGNAEMIDNLRKYCRTNGMAEHEMQGVINISLKNKWVYVENAKVGCSTLKYNLVQLELEESGLRKNLLSNKIISEYKAKDYTPHKTLASSKFSEYCDHATIDLVTKFIQKILRCLVVTRILIFKNYYKSCRCI